MGGRKVSNIADVSGSEHQPGKASEDTDAVEGRFAELVPYEKIVEAVECESEDAFAGEMKLIVSLVDAGEGTEVTLVCEDTTRSSARGQRAGLP